MITLEKLETYLSTGMANRFWYQESQAAASRWCQSNGDRDLTEFLSVVAILSPRVQVVRNVSLAKQWTTTRNDDGIMSQRVNALKRYHSAGIVSGPKVIAFRSSLLLESGAVCIDIHMSRLFGYDKRLMSTTKEWTRKREKVQNIVRRLAKRYGMESFECQAALWCGYLQIEKNYNPNRFGPMAF